ncbi:unnamed protein product [Leptidea sinapis]|uniref:Lipase domain-containing protein n=1 Tax=Leptidea sinapis TaxID=189913 RepID=A0A5E4QHV0_9NEOP|nr:unnamed protein product [Leptidea sinapis]
MFLIILLLYLGKICNVSTMYNENEWDGYSVGFLSDCPGSDKEAIITNKTLKDLTFTIQNHKGDNIFNTRRKYNYYQMKDLAQDPNLDFNKPTFVFVSGYLDTTDFYITSNIAKVYEDIGYNVLMLDTNKFTTMVYPRAVRFMRPVGKHTAEMLAELTQLGLDPKKLEIAGLSLGAQTASYIGKNYQLIVGTKISRITGLDPAGPCFRNLGPEDRIDKNDADFVDILSTNIDGLGMAAPAGHVNIYANGGEYQPGEFIWMLCTSFCSHIRAYFLWITALSYPDSFIAIQCDSVQQARNRQCYDRQPMVTNVLGLKSNRSREGIFYLNTDHKHPYYMGVKGLQKQYDFVLSQMKAMNMEKVIKM